MGMLKPLGKREAPIEKRASEEITKRGGKCIKIVAVGMRGFPDRMILLPGLIFFAEFKKPKGGKISPHQLKWQKLITYFGFKFLFITSDENLDSVLRSIDDHMIKLMEFQKSQERANANNAHSDEL